MFQHDEQNAASEGKLINLKRLLPESLHWSAGLAERLTSIDRLNAEYARLGSAVNAENFFETCLHSLRIEPQISEEDFQRIPSEGPLVIVANHPFGGLEGVLLGMLLKQVRPDFRMMANYMINYVPEMRPWLYPVDPFGVKESSGANSRTLREAVRYVRNGGALVIFPAGEVSHLQWKTMQITDSEWTPHVATLIRMTKAAVLPMYFRGHNSTLFHLLGLIHPRCRTALLVRELFNKQDSAIEVFVGKPIPFKRLVDFENDTTLIQHLRFNSYFLRHRRHKKLMPLPKLLRQNKNRQQPIAAPFPKSELLREVEALPAEQILVDNEEFLVGYANFTQIDYLMREIGRLREIAFRDVEEGSGKALDLDNYDASYLHLFLWNKTKQELAGGYRLGLSDKITTVSGLEGLYTHSLFELKQRFLMQINPAIEMGRSFIHPEYQRQPASLSLLWRGIGEFIARNPRYVNLFGPVSISQSYSSTSRDLLLRYLKNNHYDRKMAEFVKARTPYRSPKAMLARGNARTTPKDLDEVSNLIAEIEKDNKGVPVLVRHYLRLGAQFLSFNVDRDFANALDGLIVVNILNVHPSLAKRFMGKENYVAYQRFHADQRNPHQQAG
jgi:putative hemolysin